MQHCVNIKIPVTGDISALDIGYSCEPSGHPRQDGKIKPRVEAGHPTSPAGSIGFISAASADGRRS